jgi:hypothetical protein
MRGVSNQSYAMLRATLVSFAAVVILAVCFSTGETKSGYVVRDGIQQFYYSMILISYNSRALFFYQLLFLSFSDACPRPGSEIGYTPCLSVPPPYMHRARDTGKSHFSHKIKSNP